MHVKSDREVLYYPFCCLSSHKCIHKSTLMSHLKAKQVDIKSRAPFSKTFQNAVQIASQERLFQNGFWNTKNGDLSNTKSSNGQDVQEGLHILRSVHKRDYSSCYSCCKQGQLRGGGEITIRVWRDCDRDRHFSKWVCEGNGGQFKHESTYKP